MNRPTLLLLSSLASISLVGCGLFGDQGYDIRITTDREQYELTLGSETKAAVTMENLGEETVYFHCGDGAGSEYWVDGELAHPADLFFNQCVPSDEQAFMPGQKRVRQFLLPYGQDIEVPDSLIVYRYRILLTKDLEAARTHPADLDPDREIDIEMQRSNEFRVFLTSEQ